MGAWGDFPRDGGRAGTAACQAHERGVAGRYIRVFSKGFLGINARWPAWDRTGPGDASPRGAAGDVDSAMCQRAKTYHP